MAPGKHAKSPVLTALKKASNITRAPIHVHISQSSLQKISKKHAERVFTYFGLDKAPEQNSILIFLNLKNRKFHCLRRRDRRRPEKIRKRKLLGTFSKKLSRRSAIHPI